MFVVGNRTSRGKSESYGFFLPKEVKNGVQKIEGPLWKVPRCWSVFCHTVNKLGDGVLFRPVIDPQTD